MSLQRSVNFASQLPPVLRDQVVSYAESVERAMPQLFAEIAKPIDKERSDKVVLVSSISKAYSLIVATFWSLENNMKILSRSDVNRIRIGAMDFSSNSSKYLKMRDLVNELDKLLYSKEWKDVFNETPIEILRRTYDYEH